MLNTTPATWAASSIPTSTKMNTEIRDAITGIQAAWTSFTTTWTASSVNPTAASHTITADYTRFGKTVHFRIRVVFGATNYGTGTYSFTLPVAPLSLVAGDGIGGTAIIYDLSGAARKTASLAWSTTSLAIFLLEAGAGANVTQASPYTLAAGDVISINGTYQAA